MKVINFLFYFLFASAFFMEGCSSFKKSSSINESKDDVIQIAIADFSKHCRLYKSNNVFHIDRRDAANNENVIIVDIGGNNSKLLLNKQTKVGSKGKMPSKYIEANGKLFYWWDDRYPLTEKALAIFGKYKLLQDDEGGSILLPDYIPDEKQKFAFYYFCKNNYKIYKSVVTNDGKFYHNAPEIDCKCDSLTLNISSHPSRE